MARNERIPWAKPEFWGNEKRYVCDVLESQWISSGPFVQRLEDEFAKFNGIDYAIAISNGTAALHAAYLSLGIKPGDEIVVPGFAFMAAANVALHMAAVPVFTDVDPNNWCMTAEDIERCLSTKTKLIVAVHTYGNICEMESLLALANKHKIPVIEDAAEAFGCRYRDRFAGTLGIFGTYSFHAAKTITTGEGGMIVTHSEELKKRLHLYRSQGVGRTRYWHEVIGHNFRLTDVQAAIGCAQLEKIGEIIAARERMYAMYQRRLLEIPGVVMQQLTPNVKLVPWVVAIQLAPDAYPQGRDQVMLELSARGIETRPGFYTPTAMSHVYKSGQLTNADHVSTWTLVLPSFPSLSEQQIDNVCSALKQLRR